MTAIFRPMAVTDQDFVVSGWSSSLRTSRFAGLVSMARWADVMHAEIDAILRRQSTRVIVAEEPGELVETDGGPRAWLYGFIAIRCDLAAPYVYYVYVKGKFRRARERLGLDQGYATQLFAAAGIDPAGRWSYACRTSSSEAIAAGVRDSDGRVRVIPGTGRIPRAEWDPLPARYEHPNDRDQEARRAAQGRHPDQARSLSRRR